MALRRFHLGFPCFSFLECDQRFRVGSPSIGDGATSESGEEGELCIGEHLYAGECAICNL